MEDNTISMFMDVKLDIRERKLEFSHMKAWSRYFVRVEAVKCFPCYMRISFFSSPNDQATDLIVRINIPGLTVQMATSRTKQHSYGLFWKNNRKRCCAYFALETQLLCERHLRWMKKSIRNLELYRQEMMQLRRASRTPVYEIRQEMQPLDPLASPTPTTAVSRVAPDDMGIYQNLDNTQNIMDLQDILGPLPTVPSTERSEGNASVVNWSRRVSGMSGIYEEIRDDLVCGNSRLSRASIASGIYEEMRLVVDGVGKSGPEVEVEMCTPPPPLPPRTRANTNEDFDEERPFTAPDVEMLKKKRHWLRLDSMFGRRRTPSTESQGSPSGKKVSTGKEKKTSSKVVPVADDGAVVHRDKVCRLRLMENKRNSFSSPDLSRLKMSESPEGPRGDGVDNVSCDNLSDGNGSCTSEFYPQHDIDYIEEDCCFASSEFLNMSAASSSSGPLGREGEADVPCQGEGFDAALPDMRRLNISERILEGFNHSANSSTINLVGSGCVPAQNSALTSVLPPAIKEDDMDGYLEMGPIGTGFNRQKLDEVIYRNNPPPKAPALGLCGQESEESMYMSMSGTGKLPEPIRSSSTSSSSSGVSSASDQSCNIELVGKSRCSIDDKIPSYYPNPDFVRTPPPRKSGSPCTPEGKRASGLQTATTLPRTVKSAQRAPTEATVEAHERMQASFRTPKATGRRLCSRNVLKPTHASRAMEKESSASDGARESSPKLYQKYATLARISSPSKYSGKPKDVEEDGRLNVPANAVTSSPVSRRFGSLPRFGKIDLSPLRMKINSVLQRHNSGNL